MSPHKPVAWWRGGNPLDVQPATCHVIPITNNSCNGSSLSPAAEPRRNPAGTRISQSVEITTHLGQLSTPVRYRILAPNTRGME
ncbi:uncharacterized protein Dyak_GE28920 [Drosophila yakuba]|uniref:Uncharacterized protein n=1 Tax=Drosophila yakuba TaxID=7245 RepID=A0A0R1DN38_DROYA|nr:uncharacterized protein Dyak_GE28920 [Drosophila yakuba]